MATRLPYSPAAFGRGGTAKRRPKAEDRDYLSWVHRLPCIVCGTTQDIEAAHIRYHSFIHGKSETGVGRKSDDRWVVSLCAHHHRTGPDAQHNSGERLWWKRQGIDPLIIAALLYSHFSVDDEDAAVQVAISAREISAGT